MAGEGSSVPGVVQEVAPSIANVAWNEVPYPLAAREADAQEHHATDSGQFVIGSRSAHSWLEKETYLLARSKLAF